MAVGGHDVLLVDFVNAMAATGYTPKAMIEHYGITDASFAKALGRRADGVMGISVWLPTASFTDDLFGSAGDYAKAFEEKHGSPPDYTAAGCSAAGQVLQAAVEKLGETPSLSEEARVKLNDLIAGTDLTTFYGPIRFASEGDHFHNNTALDPMLVQIQGGQVKAIAPKESAQAPIHLPARPAGLSAAADATAAVRSFGPGLPGGTYAPFVHPWSTGRELHYTCRCGPHTT